MKRKEKKVSGEMEKTAWLLVRKRTISTERPPPVCEF
jgi:hypothetical protein